MQVNINICLIYFGSAVDRLPGYSINNKVGLLVGLQGAVRGSPALLA
jgi:hypothetical protein